MEVPESVVLQALNGGKRPAGNWRRRALGSCPAAAGKKGIPFVPPQTDKVPGRTGPKRGRGRVGEGFGGLGKARVSTSAGRLGQEILAGLEWRIPGVEADLTAVGEDSWSGSPSAGLFTRAAIDRGPERHPADWKRSRMVARCHGIGGFHPGRNQALVSASSGTGRDERTGETPRGRSARLRHQRISPPFFGRETRPLRAPGGGKSGMETWPIASCNPLLPNPFHRPVGVGYRRV